jgi:hypothetical protein
MGNGTFVDVTTARGIVDPDYYGFSVLFSDLDDDGWADITWRTTRCPTCSSTIRLTAPSGSRRSKRARGDGRRRASRQGWVLDAGDYDGDGRLDLVKTNFAQDYTSLFHNDGGGCSPTSVSNQVWRRRSAVISGGVWASSISTTTVCSISSSRTDTSTRTSSAPARAPIEQRNQVFQNIGGGRFRDATTRVGGPLLVEKSSRGTAFGDYDDDGDIDVLVSVLDEGPMLLRNDTPSSGHWLTFRLEGTQSNRSAIGAKVTVDAPASGTSRRSGAAAATCRRTTPGSTSGWVRRRWRIAYRSGGRTGRRKKRQPSPAIASTSPARGPESEWASRPSASSDLAPARGAAAHPAPRR